MEKQLEEFMEENERISRKLYNRDLEAEKMKDQNRKAVKKSENILRQSISPIRNNNK